MEYLDLLLKNIEQEGKLTAISNIVNLLDNKYLDKTSENMGEISYLDMIWTIKTINNILKGGK